MSANTRAPSTIVTIALTGQTEFTIPFEYLARKYVEVTLLGINRLPLVLNTDFRFVTKTLISLTRPYTSEYKQIELRRVTSATERLVDFHDGSILRAYDLNLSQIQTLHVAEEARDLTADTIGVNDEGHLDARNRKIINLAYAENGGDAIPFGQVVAWNDSAYNSMIRAEAAQAVTEASTAIAVQAKNDARDSELSAQVSAGGSAASAQTAVDARNDTLAAQTDVTTKHDNVVVKHDEVMQVVPKLDDAVNMMSGLGNVPVGVVAMTMTPHVPAGWVRCGEQFDKATYPALARLYPSGVVPSFDERFAKGVSRGNADKLGEHGAQSLPVHQHTIPRVNVEGQTTSHDYGSVGAETPARTVGYTDTYLEPNAGPHELQDGGVRWG
ncbi:MAG: phage tail fiber protein, partial [Aeromonas veronii]